MTFPLSIQRFAGVWLAMALAMTVNGIFREVVLKRLTNDDAAGVISATMGIVFIGLITRIGLRPLAAAAPSVADLAFISFMLVVLTVVFECALGRFVDHKSWAALLDHYRLWRGELWPLVLLWLAITPFVWGRWLQG